MPAQTAVLQTAVQELGGAAPRHLAAEGAAEAVLAETMAAPRHATMLEAPIVRVVAEATVQGGELSATAVAERLVFREQSMLFEVVLSLLRRVRGSTQGYSIRPEADLSVRAMSEHSSEALDRAAGFQDLTPPAATDSRMAIPRSVR